MTELMSLSQEEPLTLSQKMTVKFHLLMCPECRRFDDNNRVLKEMIKKHKNLKGWFVLKRLKKLIWQHRPNGIKALAMFGQYPMLINGGGMGFTGIAFVPV